MDFEKLDCIMEEENCQGLRSANDVSPKPRRKTDTSLGSGDMSQTFHSKQIYKQSRDREGAPDSSAFKKLD